LLGLYVADLQRAGPDRLDRLAFRLTAVAIVVLALTLGLLAAAACWAPAGRGAFEWLSGGVALSAAVAAIVFALRAVKPTAFDLPRLALAMVLILTLVLGPLYLRLNGWLSLEDTAMRIRSVAGDTGLVLLQPDETTVALSHLYLPRERTLGSLEGGAAETAAGRAAVEQGARLVWLVPDHVRWDARRWLGYLGYSKALPVQAPVTLPDGYGSLRVVGLVERAGGRTYAVLAPRGAADDGR
jgi:hypothetical protein